MALKRKILTEKTNCIKIYSLSDPETMEVRYVGKTEQELHRRLNDHIIESEYSQTHKGRWIKKMVEKGVKPTIEILDKCAISDWPFWEIYWIAQMKSWGFRLTNSTDGGENPPVCEHNSEITKKRMSEAKNSKKKAVLVYDTDDNFIMECESISEAVNKTYNVSRWIDIGIRNKKFDKLVDIVGRICNKRACVSKKGKKSVLKTYKGYRFKFK